MENLNKLDLAAKLFPSVTNKDNSSVFRLSVVLKEEIDRKTLQVAVNMIYERFSIFFMRLRTGFFWNYFDKNRLYFTVEEEENSPCFTIISHENKDFMLKVLYYGNRISVEAFHSITDGSGVVEFLKSLTFYYLTIKHHHNFDDEGKILLFDEIDEENFEDSFDKFFSKPATNIKKNKSKTFQKNSYRIKGKKFDKKGNNVVTGIVSIESIKKYCKDKKCTITGLLLANLFFAIYNAKQKFENNKKPIVVTVPVNLRAKFESNTLKNFFGVVNISYAVNDDTDFFELIDSITEQLNIYTDKDYLESESRQNAKISDNPFSKHTPLFIKNMVLPIGFTLMGEVKKTISVSNIGKIDFPSGLTPYIEHTEMIIYPTLKSPINCSVCSFNDKLSINFVRTIKEADIIREFFITLKEKINSDMIVYSNQWEEDKYENLQYL